MRSPSATTRSASQGSGTIRTCLRPLWLLSLQRLSTPCHVRGLGAQPSNSPRADRAPSTCPLTTLERPARAQMLDTRQPERAFEWHWVAGDEFQWRAMVRWRVEIFFGHGGTSKRRSRRIFLSPAHVLLCWCVVDDAVLSLAPLGRASAARRRTRRRLSRGALVYLQIAGAACAAGCRAAMSVSTTVPFPAPTNPIRLLCGYGPPSSSVFESGALPPVASYWEAIGVGLWAVGKVRSRPQPSNIRHIRLLRSPCSHLTFMWRVARPQVRPWPLWSAPAATA